MSTVQEIETAISALPRAKLSELRSWFSRFDAGEWDKQIEHDAADGRLDAFYKRMQAENEGQPDLALHDSLDQEKLS